MKQYLRELSGGLQNQKACKPLSGISDGNKIKHAGKPLVRLINDLFCLHSRNE